MNPASKSSKLLITDLTFRDGHQSLLATRMRTEDMEAVAQHAGRVGYFAMEVWGGATFDSMHRFLGEDPWERPRRLRKFIPQEVKFMMLLRGQNLVGYRNYGDDVVEAFVEEACDAGIEIFRVFDALNDERNIETAARVILRKGMHFQGALSYTVAATRMGEPPFTLEYWVAKAKALAVMGAHSICIKDMAGLLSPEDAAVLIPAIKQATSLPLELHSHTTAGLAEYTMLRAIDAGVDIIDTCSAPLASRTSHPAVEPIAFLLKGSKRDPSLDLKALERVASGLEQVLPKYRSLLDQSRTAIVDIGALQHQIPGGMYSNLVNQLRELNAESRLGEVFEELPKVRAELGFPPLVTPTSQMVGVQAVQNVLFGKPGSIAERYKMISDQVKDYCYGLYGLPPAEVDAEVRSLALKGYKRGEKPIECRPANVLDPELAKARAECGDLARDRKELLIYSLFPTTGKRFLQVKRGLEAPPAEWRARTLEDVKRDDEIVKKALSGEMEAKKPKESSAGGPGSRKYTVRVDGEAFVVEVEGSGIPRIRPGAAVGIASPARPAQPSPAPRPAAAGGKGAVVTPMPGTLIRYTVKPGDSVKSGSVVAVLEAMKMENHLTTAVDGVVGQLVYKPGDRVAKDTVLLTIT